MRLQQMLFAAFASSVLIVGCKELPQPTTLSDVNPLIEQLDQTSEFMTHITNHDMNDNGSLTQHQTFTQRLEQITTYIKEQSKQMNLTLNKLFLATTATLNANTYPIHPLKVFQGILNPALTLKTHHFSFLANSADWYPSSYKGMESFFKEEQIMIHGEMHPLNI